MEREGGRSEREGEGGGGREGGWEVFLFKAGCVRKRQGPGGMGDVVTLGEGYRDRRGMPRACHERGARAGEVTDLGGNDRLKGEVTYSGGSSDRFRGK